MKLFVFWLSVGLAFGAHFDGFSDDKYDLAFMPWDMAPVWYLIGTWENISPQKTTLESVIPFADTIDIGIDPLPQFGFRTLNMTGTVRDDCGNTVYSEWGHIIVANKSSWDRFNKVAYFTASDSGNAIMEEGSVERSTISLTTSSFAQRSLNLKEKLTLMRMTRKITVKGDFMQLKLNIILKDREENHHVNYQRRRGHKCFRKCFSVGRNYPVKYACSICINPPANWFREGLIPPPYDNKADPVTVAPSQRRCTRVPSIHASRTTVPPFREQPEAPDPRAFVDSKITPAPPAPRITQTPPTPAPTISQTPTTLAPRTTQTPPTPTPRVSTGAITEPPTTPTPTTPTVRTTNSPTTPVPPTAPPTPTPETSTPTTADPTETPDIQEDRPLKLPNSVKILNGVQFEGVGSPDENDPEQADKVHKADTADTIGTVDKADSAGTQDDGDLSSAVNAFYAGALRQAVDLFYQGDSKK